MVEDRDTFEDLPILAELEQQLRAAGSQHETRERPGGVRRRAPWLVAVLAAVLTLGTATATALVLRSTVITAPSARDQAPEMTPLAASVRMSGLSVPDPSGAPPWTVRTSRSRTGLTCSTVGQLQDGRFGLVGLDGRFRLLPAGVVDSCGLQRPGTASLMGARTFSAATVGDTRTVLSGVAGTGLRAADLEVRGRRQGLELGRGGTFVAVLAGFPEGSAPRVTLRFSDGRVESRRFGVADDVVLDTDGGTAWKVEASRIGRSAAHCTRFFTTRTVGTDYANGPLICSHRPAGRVVAAFRRFTPGQTGMSPFMQWTWNETPARTVVWGSVRGARTVTLFGNGAPRRLHITRGKSFLAVLPATIDPAQLRLQITLDDGRRLSVRGETNVLPEGEKLP